MQVREIGDENFAWKTVKRKGLFQKPSFRVKVWIIKKQIVIQLDRITLSDMYKIIYF